VPALRRRPAGGQAGIARLRLDTRTLKLTIAYDGTHYVGWQRQAEGASIQQALEDAFAPLNGGVAPGVAAAGRTDAGVHALAQVASVNLESDLAVASVRRALNVRLPFDIRVTAVEDATPGFHARFQARGKSYRYRIVTAEVLSPFERWFAWHAPGPRDVDAMQRAAACFVGRHDFASFNAGEPMRNGTVRTIDLLTCDRADDGILVEVSGVGFLRHMVRTLVGTLMDVGAGLRPPESMPAILAARERRAAGPTVPASGLTLVSVRY
jgi:tRNA pseudouridine38-40 synthase